MPISGTAGRPRNALMAAWQHQVMQLPAILVRLIDPANGYFEKQRPRRHDRPVYRGGAIFGPGVPGGSRQATHEEVEAMRSRSRDWPDRQRPELTAAQQDEVAAAIRSLRMTGHADLGSGADRVEARIIKFWHGDSILAVMRDSGSSLTRIPRRPGAHDREFMFRVIADHISRRTDE